MHLKTDEFHLIQNYVVQNGLSIPDVQEDIIDHLCCIVEVKLGEGIDFERAFQLAQQTISKNDIQQIQKDTIYFLTIKNQLFMIKAIFITAYVSMALLVTGLFFAIFGYVLDLPDIIGFSFLLGSATIFCTGFLPTLFLHKYKRYIEQIKA